MMADEDFSVADLRAAAKVLASQDRAEEKVAEMKLILQVTMTEVKEVAEILGAEIGQMKEAAQAVVDELAKTKADLAVANADLTEALRR